MRHLGCLKVCGYAAGADEMLHVVWGSGFLFSRMQYRHTLTSSPASLQYVAGRDSPLPPWYHHLAEQLHDIAVRSFESCGGVAFLVKTVSCTENLLVVRTTKSDNTKWLVAEHGLGGFVAATFGVMLGSMLYPERQNTCVVLGDDSRGAFLSPNAKVNKHATGEAWRRAERRMSEIAAEFEKHKFPFLAYIVNGNGKQVAKAYPTEIMESPKWDKLVNGLWRTLEEDRKHLRRDWKKTPAYMPRRLPGNRAKKTLQFFDVDNTPEADAQNPAGGVGWYAARCMDPGRYDPVPLLLLLLLLLHSLK